jgi:RecJ-like exonuclease
MVCVACNGKGYVIEKQRELVCSECQGRGECFLCDSDRQHKQESQEVLGARKAKEQNQRKFNRSK